jgi:hypothetical protein
MSIETYDQADYNRAAGLFESMGLPVEMLAPPPLEVDWMLQKRRPESTVWTFRNWTAEICRTTEARQFDARLHLAPDDVTMLDSVLIEPEQIPPLMTFETFEADMLDRFTAWIRKNGRQAIGDALMTIKIQTRHAHPLLDAADDLIRAALRDQDTDLAGALIALQSALRQALP